MSLDIARKMSVMYFLSVDHFCIGLHLQSEVITLKNKTGSLLQFFICVRDFLFGPVNHF